MILLYVVVVVIICQLTAGLRQILNKVSHLSVGGIELNRIVSPNIGPSRRESIS